MFDVFSRGLKPAFVGVATMCVLATGAAVAASGALQLASLSPDEINRETAQAVPVDLTDIAVPSPPGAEDIQVSYKIHLGGFHLVQVDLRSVVHDNEYLALSSVRTKGLVDVFASADITLVSTGDVIEGRVAPRTYNSDQKEKKKRQLVGLLFGEDGPLEVASDPPYDLDRFPVSEDLKFQTVDPLSAALYVSLGSGMDHGDPCTRTVPVFDGKRRYNLEMTYVDEIEEFSSGRGGYLGPAIQCQLQYKRIAGFKPPKPGKKRTQVPPIDIWLAPLNDGSLYVPVRMQADSDFGAAVVRATALSVNKIPAKS